MQLPPPDLIGLMAVLVLAGIVVWDAVWLVRQSQLVPELGPAPGGYAWSSGGAEEAIRHWGNLFSMAAMLVLPWGFIRMSDTSAMWAVVWDVLLLLHLVGLLVPKRYRDADAPDCRRTTLRVGTAETRRSSTTSTHHAASSRLGHFWPAPHRC